MVGGGGGGGGGGRGGCVCCFWPSFPVCHTKIAIASLSDFWHSVIPTSVFILMFLLPCLCFFVQHVNVRLSVVCCGVFAFCVLQRSGLLHGVVSVLM